MISPVHKLEIDLRALTYLVSFVICRLHDIDPVWRRRLLKELKAGGIGASAGSDTLFRRAMGNCGFKSSVVKSQIMG